MTDLDAIPDLFAAQEAVVVPTPRRHRHVWEPRWVDLDNEDARVVTGCRLCNVIRDETKARTGKQSRNYGNRAELKVARTYGGQKIGHAGGPVDVRGAEFNTQVKTHRRPPPREWTSAFNAMAANRERLPRLLLRFVMGPGVPPEDFVVVPGKVWLDWFGRDE